MNQGDGIELQPLDPDLIPIYLPDSSQINVGRNPECNIKDISCSRKQLIIVADYLKKSISITRTGLCPSILNGKIIEKNATHVGHNDMILEVLPNKIKYRIVCKIKEISTKTTSSSSSQNKRKGSGSILDFVESKKMRPTFEWDRIPPPASQSGYKTLIRCTSNLENNYLDEASEIKIAAFDMDGTLIKTKSGNVFPKGDDDWRIWDNKVIDSLQKLHKTSYKIVIFTNQASLRIESKIPPFKKKIEKILSFINLPIDVYIATTYDIFRKPSPGMWNQLICDIGKPVNMVESFYVGDAAGRIENWNPGKKKDFSMADRLLAKNVGLSFFTPEEYFLGGVAAPFNEPPFEPEKIPCTNFNFIPSQKQEAIVMVGSPASGKTHFVKNHLKAYHIISMDILKTWAKCVKEMHRLLSLEKNVVIDNTNPKVERRKEIIDICKQYQVPVRCFKMSSSINHCLHNNKFREAIGSEHIIVESSVIMTYWKMFEEPTIEEGFSDVEDIPFVPNFESEEHKRLYFMHLVDAKKKV